jgi:hypothetical protein
MEASTTRAQLRHPDRHFGPAVVFSTLSPGEVSAWFTESVAATLFHDGAKPLGSRRIITPHGGTIFNVSGPRIAEARTQIVEQFLTAESFKGAGWLLMVDSDMVWRPEALDLLFESADAVERPIVGGLCFAGQSPATMYPTIYRFDRDDEGRITLDKEADYPRDQLVKVGATGGAFLLVHRTVFLRMSQPHPKGFGTMPDGALNSYPWFVEGHVDKHGRPFGEDIAFCMRANALGIPVHVDTRAKVSHHKSVFLDEQLYDQGR